MKQASRLRGATSDKVKHAFFSHYLCALAMCRLHDLNGLKLVRDHSNKNLTSFNGSMSDTAFWGRSLFNPHDPLVKKLLAYGHADQLHDQSGNVLVSRIHKIMDVIHQDPIKINWDEIITVLYIMRHRFTIRSSYFEHIVRDLKDWPKLSDSRKRGIVSNCFLYLMQSDPESNLIQHMRDLSGKTMLNDLKGLAMKVIAIRKLGECQLTLNEEGAVVSTSGIATGDRMMLGNRLVRRPVDSVPEHKPEESAVTKKIDKNLKKRKRKFKAIYFRAPEHFKKDKND